MRATKSGATVAALLLASITFLQSSALASEPVSFNSGSVPPTPFKVKQAKKQGIELKTEPGIPLTGRLSKPAGDGPFPAVVLLHGCRGMRPFQDAWAAKLTEWGYVALQVDSFGPRDITEICTDFQQAYWHGVLGGQTTDAFGALSYLGSLSFVDNDRVATMGWSDGPLGSVVRLGSHVHFDQKFRAGIGLYPYCKPITSGDFYAPVLVLSGGKDDWNPARYCERMAKAGVNLPVPITLKVYPHAYYGFDDFDLPEFWYYEEAQNGHKNPPGGASLGYSRDAHEDSIKQVREFLAEHLG